jgi:aminoglycoside phosphotransferase (APT) family kinase protein
MRGTPAAEHHIDEALVHSLLLDQHADLAQLPIQQVDAGWDNAMFRLGDQLAVRLPRRAAVASLITHEQTWLPQIASRLTLPVPVPVRTGRPAKGYRWHWSVLPWLPGVCADHSDLDSTEGSRFGLFLRSLHKAAPPDAPLNPVRGVPLTQRGAVLEPRIQRLLASTTAITSHALHLWRGALAAPIDVAPTWLHGDLHLRNILVEDRRISGIIDWGDITSGDPATDLASIWMLFIEPEAREQAFAAYGQPSQATLLRAKGWAVLFGVFLLDTGLVDNPRNATIGERILHTLDDVSHQEVMRKAPKPPNVTQSAHWSGLPTQPSKPSHFAICFLMLFIVWMASSRSTRSLVGSCEITRNRSNALTAGGSAASRNSYAVRRTGRSG